MASVLVPLVTDLTSSEGKIGAPDLGEAILDVDTPSSASSTFQPTTGTVYFFEAKAAEGGALTTVDTYVNTAGATLTAGDNLVGLYALVGTTLTQIMVSADLSVPWVSTGLQTAALAASTGAAGTLSVVEGATYYFGLLAVGTTTPVFVSDGTATAAAKRGNTTTSARVAFSGATSQTALPATYTITSGTDVAKTVMLGAH